jgi:uncharacterized protein (TIGR00251 family)
MIVNIRVIPKSSRAQVRKDGQVYKVHLTRPAQDGQANAQLIDLLAQYFQVKRYNIDIVSGLKSKAKVVKIGI